MTEDERIYIEKEIQGLNAKLKWDHAEETSKENWRQRLKALQERLDG